MIASELIIGNYLEVSLASGNGRKRFNKIGVQDIVRIFEENFKSFIYEPIPLTEEWLLNFGFEFIKTESAFNTFTDKNNNYFLQIDNRKNNGIYKILYDDGCELIDFAIKGIKYVHQLQNLYFALTGEELKLKS